MTVLFIYGCTGSSLQSAGFSYCGAWALGLQTSVVVAPGLIAPWHVESSQSRDQTHVLCIGRQILIHSATREALDFTLHFYTLIQRSGATLKTPVPYLFVPLSLKLLILQSL